MEIFTFLQHQVTHKVMNVLDKVRNKKKKIAEKKEAELNKSLKPKTKQDLKKMYTELTNDEIKQVLCHLKELGMVDIKRLLNGNEFSSMSGENGIKVEFSRKYN